MLVRNCSPSERCLAGLEQSYSLMTPPVLLLQAAKQFLCLIEDVGAAVTSLTIYAHPLYVKHYVEYTNE